MNAKEFFRPTTGKIVLTIILLFIILFLALYQNRNITCPIDEETGIVKPCEPGPPNYINITLFSLIPFYLISCLLVLIYNKVKKR